MTASDDGRRTNDELHERARSVLGVAGNDAPPEPPLRTIIKRSASGWYPLAVLSLLGLIDALDLQVFTVLAPEIKRAFALTNAEVGLISALQGLAVVFGALPMAALAGRHSRATIVKLSGIAWGLLQIVTGLIRGKFELGLVRTLRGLSDASRQSIFLPLLADTYPPEGRNRIFGSYFSTATLGSVLGPGLIGLLAAVLGLSFRIIFPLTGVLTLVCVGVAVRLRDPGYGRYDTDQIREAVRSHLPDVAEAADEPDVTLRFGEAVNRLLAIGTLYRVLVGLAVVGIGLVGAGAFITLFVEREYGLDSFGRGAVLSILGAGSAAGYALGGKFGERLFRRSPDFVLRTLGILLAAYGVMLALSVHQPNVYLFTSSQFLATAAVAAVVPATFNVVSAIVPPRLRGYSFAVQGIYIGFFGGLVGSLLIGTIADRAGYRFALSLVVIPSVIGGWIMARAGSTFERDLEQLSDEIVEDETNRMMRAQHAAVPIVELRSCDFYYGSVQVLFDVNVAIEEGAFVAMLGTNGAGKSTLLRTISGLGIPRRGTVRFRGQNITYLAPHRRVSMGMLHVPSDRAIFPSLTVIENLRVAGYTLGPDETRLNRRIDESFDLLPILRERRHQQAGTLSGGEQQMLALARALILEPTLLCIDELSLGLAPKVVASLLDVVRRIHQGGTTVVLVEQSVNLALSVAEHAYFMERGEVRFSGPTAELLGRDDLLRAVFLEGAARGVLELRKEPS